MLTHPQKSMTPPNDRSSSKTLTLNILDKQFTLTIDPEDEKALIEAAAIVSDRLKACTGNSAEMRALTVAFNLAYEYVCLRDRSEQLSQELHAHLMPLMQQLNERPDPMEDNPDRAAMIHEQLASVTDDTQKK